MRNGALDILLAVSFDLGISRRVSMHRSTEGKRIMNVAYLTDLFNASRIDLFPDFVSDDLCRGQEIVAVKPAIAISPG